jgi:F-type H+-transporting ATPase subunit epsilon
MDVEAEGVVVPGGEGDFMVLPNHAPMLSTIRPGVVEVNEVGKSEATKLYIKAGFAEVSEKGLVVLAEEAIDIAELSKVDVEQKLKNAQEDLEDAQNDEESRNAEEAIKHLSSLLKAL